MQLLVTYVLQFIATVATHRQRTIVQLLPLLVPLIALDPTLFNSMCTNCQLINVFTGIPVALWPHAFTCRYVLHVLLVCATLQHQIWCAQGRTVFTGTFDAVWQHCGVHRYVCYSAATLWCSHVRLLQCGNIVVFTGTFVPVRQHCGVHGYVCYSAATLWCSRVCC